jgi:hypothetical protein
LNCSKGEVDAQGKRHCEKYESAHRGPCETCHLSASSDL